MVLFTFIAVILSLLFFISFIEWVAMIIYDRKQTNLARIKQLHFTWEFIFIVDVVFIFILYAYIATAFTYSPVLRVIFMIIFFIVGIALIFGAFLLLRGHIGRLYPVNPDAKARAMEVRIVELEKELANCQAAMQANATTKTPANDRAKPEEVKPEEAPKEPEQKEATPEDEVVLEELDVENTDSNN